MARVLVGVKRVIDYAVKMTAALLHWPQGTFCVKVDKTDAGISREIYAIVETIKTKMPAVHGADLRLNTPRYASLPNIMKAKNNLIKKVAAKDAVDTTPRIDVLSVEDPPVRQAGAVVLDVDFKEGGHN
uniref:Electron transfer flavoprotein alpha/beta-subunit N-terminal domain-containing protein n=1 Tax=Megaselia scalaris TaxID=36166 RepID=T1H5V6_MEGSC